tara:strand:- start:22647 stop:22889 length:243 start_codon:yes stop_codon:yes gene_type:complete
MSYCRWADDSDVYVILHTGGYYQVMVAKIGKSECQTFNYTDIKECIDKLKKLETDGIKVPKRAITRLENEYKNSLDGLNS